MECTEKGCPFPADASGLCRSHALAIAEPAALARKPEPVPKGTPGYFGLWRKDHHPRTEARPEKKPAFLPPILVPASPNHVAVSVVIDAAASVMGIDREALLAPSRRTDIARRRQVLTYILARQFSTLSLPRMGQILKQHHTTVLHSIRCVTEALKTDKELQTVVKQIEEAI